jgi:D-threo-aldose 1-dehydrogenase
MSNATRRTFLSTMATGTAVLASTSLFASAPGPGSVMPTKGKPSGEPLPTNTSTNGGRYRPKYRFGLGGVAIGNAFEPTTDEAAEGALETSWEMGVRYFDTSPFYGFGLSERRFGMLLHEHEPEEYELSTKVGRIFTATDSPPEEMIWKKPSPFEYRYDYTADGVRRSIEDSLQRLGVSKIDIVFIHDLSPDNEDMKDQWTEHFEIAAKGAMPELTRMRDEGVIKAWGLGVNRSEPALRTLEVADPDIFLLATQYSLMDHDEALNHTFPALDKRGISVVVGSPLNAGYLAGRDRYNYSGEIPAEVPDKRKRMTEITTEHGIDLRTAALQFAAAPPTVSAVIPGARNAEQAKANADSMQIAIPNDFWAALRDERLIAKNAPTPKVR